MGKLINNIEFIQNLCLSQDRIPFELRENENISIELLNVINNYHMLVKNKYIKVLQHIYLNKTQSNSNINFGQIKSIKYIGEIPTYDIEVEHDHSYIANGIVAHNTCNLANDVTEGIVSDLYFDAWEKGLKGTTIYRDGCREGVLTQISKKREDDKFYESYVNAPKRPKSLEADFYTTKVKGEIFYVMIGLYHNKPYEIFVYRAGSDAKVVKNHKGVITKVKKNHYKFDSDVIKLNDLASKLNTEELATVLYSSMLMRTGANIKYIVKTSKKVDENISSFTSAMNRIISKYIPVESVDGEVCPQCGGKIIRENGCQHCADCDWSKCG
jgi:hypothetical protein